MARRGISACAGETAKIFFFEKEIAVILFVGIEGRRTTAGRGKDRANIGQTTSGMRKEIDPRLPGPRGGISRRTAPVQICCNF